MLLLLSFFASWLAFSTCSSVLRVQEEKDGQVRFGNNHVELLFDSQRNAVLGLYGDFLGQRNFSTNTLNKPFSLVAINAADGSPQAIKSLVQWRWKISDDKLTVSSHATAESISETWNFEVSALSREIVVTIEGQTVDNVDADRLSYSFDLPQPYLSGFFSSGAVQMMGHSDACLGTNDTLERAYFLGDGSALDVAVYSSAFTAENHAVVLRSRPTTATTRSVLELQVAGRAYPHMSKQMATAWNPRCWTPDTASNTSAPIPADTTWQLTLGLVPNNRNFPTYSLRAEPESRQLGSPTDLETFLLGVYASAAGCLQTFYDRQTGIVAPTISHPDVGYSPDTNFFDPDNFITLSALMYSGDEYLLTQVRDVLLRTAQTMCGLGSDTDEVYCAAPRSKFPLGGYKTQFHARRYGSVYSSSRRGQIMHHFVSLVPTYESIAGSEQLGPNVFWTSCALRYLAVTADAAGWAEQVFSFVDLSTHFLLSFIDADKLLVRAPGPLWIDVLVRENYTADSAAAFVPLLRDLADFYDYCAQLDTPTALHSLHTPAPHLLGGANTSVRATTSQEDLREFAAELRDIAEAVTSAINAHLWNTSSDDHLITQLNLDSETTRDFVDYDSNLLASAFAVLPPDRVARMLQRVDGGEHTHIRATWCSEVAYTGDACDCYIVGGSVCGDSVVTLARIGYVDVLTRWRLGQSDFLRDTLLTPLQTDLIADTWLYERYDASGAQIRTPFYFEYPSLVTMALQEAVLGLQLGVRNVTLCPASRAAESVSLRMGGVSVRFDPLSAPQTVTLSLPGDADTAWDRAVAVCGLKAGGSYRLLRDAQPLGLIVASAEGVAQFRAAFVTGQTWTLLEQL